MDAAALGRLAPPSLQSFTPVSPPLRLVLLAPATSNIVPTSSRPSRNKAIAMQFVNADKETQTNMLRDPNVARAILQTLAESPQQPVGVAAPQVSPTAPAPGAAGTGPAGSPGPLAVPLASPQAAAPPAQPTLPPMPAGGPLGGAGLAPGAPTVSGKPPLWSGLITLARNMGKRLPARALLLHGRIEDVEVALRSAAGNTGVLDITHRMPFEEVARRGNFTVLALAPASAVEQAQFEEYVRYFQSKMRAGVARLDGALALYVVPPAENVPCLRDTLYALGPHIPRTGCLLAVIAAAAAAVAPAAPAKAPSAAVAAPAVLAAPVRPAASKQPAEASADKAAKPVAAAPEAAVASKRPVQGRAGDAAAGAVAPAAALATDAVGERREAEVAGDPPEDEGGSDGGPNMSSKELLDLFSNPELIKLLSEEAPEAPAS